VDQQQQFRRWRPTRRQLLWAAGIVIALAFLIIAVCGYLFGWKWTGLVKDANFHRRTLWDWLELLIVPVVLAIGGYLFTRSESKRTQDIANQQRDLDREIADERRQDDTLQAYLDGMSQLLTDKDRPLHRSQLGDSLSTVARARTLTVLPRLEGERKGSVLQFLVESTLITKKRLILKLKGADLSGAYLRGATLGGAELSGVDLSRADLSGAILEYADLEYANLSNANLEDADLWGANLEHADLSGAYLTSAILQGANLTEANLREANLQAVDMTEANLYKANLQAVDMTEAKSNLYVEAPPHAAYLFGAYMDEANLAGANLSGVESIFPPVLMELATSLEGAIMPNGQKYKDWLKTSEGQLSITKGATTWLKTYEGQLWLNEGIEDGVPGGSKGRKYLDWLKTSEGQNWLKTYKGDDAEV
jgi:uncharacterized protein YjbI with pentapeptide repeats